MAERTVLRMGEPRLLLESAPVADPRAPEIAALLVDMHDTMTALSGAGLAAPQIGAPLQVVIFGGRPSPRYPTAALVPYTVLINPVLSELSAALDEDWEGCLSVPGMRGWVPRHTSIRYQGLDAEGQVIDRQASGFHARVVQHEVDHLRGILYPMRIVDLRRFGFASELAPGLPVEDD
jgi:peptide deformylase